MSRTSMVVTVLLSAAAAFALASFFGNRRPREAPPVDQFSRLSEPGVPHALAVDRAQRIRDLRYQLTFTIPADRTAPIKAREAVRFTLQDTTGPVLLDFAAPAGQISAVSANGSDIEPHVENGHLIIGAEALRQGQNLVDVLFVAGDAPLNRNDAFLYTLFVPAHASQAFPVFDQPDLKAAYSLTLDLPRGWVAAANGAEETRQVDGDRTVISYAETKPLPTYLFAFAAGKFDVISAERNGRTFRMFHRETDPAKVQRNRDEIFDLHAAAVAWLEDYTGIPYAFGKFDFVLIPSFQFGGMEHAGAVLYNASSLLLEESATQNQKLGRASLIAHETAHMWFGDLVTMRWFDDVWMKEVFANFMAAKIVNPSFPQVNHPLRFLFAHYPSAYAVDRTEGANPIRQQLDNLSEAGGLYGAIIYQKAPIVMRQLELILGQQPFREGLREYLHEHAFGNASWPDLVRTLDPRTPVDVQAWSRAWVEQPGRPHVRTELSLDAAGRIEELAFVQADPRGRGLLWTQRLQVAIGLPDGERAIDVALDAPRVVVAGAKGLPAPLYVLPNGGGLGYGGFQLDDRSRAYLLAHLPDVGDPLTRGSAWVTLWDAFLERECTPSAMLDLALRALPAEDNEQTTQAVLGYLQSIYWRFMTPDARVATAPGVERALRAGIARARSQSLKSAYFQTFRDVAITSESVAWLAQVWEQRTSIPGLTFAEPDYAQMALELAARDVPRWREILEEQQKRMQNPDRRARFVFVTPALSADVSVRDRFFASLSDPANRAHEPWVLEALHYLHHPLRAGDAEKHIRQSLDMLPEIRRTGDIFFPKRWTDATLDGHNSATVARTVRAFLDESVDLPPRLRQIVLQSSDELFRAAAIVEPH